MVTKPSPPHDFAGFRKQRGGSGLLATAHRFCGAWCTGCPWRSVQSNETFPAARLAKERALAAPPAGQSSRPGGLSQLGRPIRTMQVPLRDADPFFPIRSVQCPNLCVIVKVSGNLTLPPTTYPTYRFLNRGHCFSCCVPGVMLCYSLASCLVPMRTI